METDFNKKPDPTEKKLPKWIVPIVAIFALLLLLIGVSLYFISQIDIGKPSSEQIPQIEQQEITHWLYFHGFNADNGDIYFDEDGDTMWIAAGRSLYKYSWSKKEILETYNTLNGFSEIATAVTKINNEIYIGTQEGLAILDLDTDKFRYLYDRNNNVWASLTDSGNVDHFEFDGQNLWMTGFGGLQSFNITTQEWKYYSYPGSDFTITGSDIYLIERGNPTPLIRRADKTTVQWNIEFQLPNYKWMYIDGSSRYLVASADPESYQRNSVLYYKNLSEGKWSEIKLPIDGTSIRYRKIAIDSDGKVYFTYENGKEKFLAVYNLEKGTLNQYPLEKIGDVGAATRGNIYPYLLQNEVWFAALGYIELDSGTTHFAPNLQKPASLSWIRAYQDGKLLVNTDLGVGIFDPRKNSFTRISEELAFDAEWIDNIIWLDFSVSAIGIEEFKLGRYDTGSGILEVKTLDHPFSFVKSQKPKNENSVLIAKEISEKRKRTFISKKEITSFNFVEEKEEPLLEIYSSSLSGFNVRPLYSEDYGILIMTKDGIKSLNPATKEYKF